MAWELLQDVGRQKDESRRAGRGKRCQQGKWHKAASLPGSSTSPEPEAMDAAEGQVWAAGSCGGLASGMSKDNQPWGQTVLALAPKSSCCVLHRHTCIRPTNVPTGSLAPTVRVRCGSSRNPGFRRTLSRPLQRHQSPRGCGDWPWPCLVKKELGLPWQVSWGLWPACQNPASLI